MQVGKSVGCACHKKEDTHGKTQKRANGGENDPFDVV